MTARDFSELPLVDVSALAEATGPRRSEAVAELGRAARDVGFFYAVGHGIEPALFEALEHAAASFFALPHARKQRYYIGNYPQHRGYVPPGEEVFYGGTQDTKEAFDLCLDLPPADYGRAQLLLGPNVWPEELPLFRRAVSAYYEQAFAFGKRLLGGFAEALELEATYFDRWLTAPPSQLRLLHYPESTVAPAPGVMGIGAHTDYECFTLLYATRPGLQVLNGNAEWVAASPVPGAFVVNIGDLFEIWSNGRFLSTSHRVVPIREERFSFPLFFNVDFETRVAPLPHLVDGEPRYQPVIAGEHLLSQTIQSFRYLRARLERAEIALPAGAHALASFGREPKN